MAGVDEQDGIQARLAARLKQTRKDRGLSLDAVSKLSGVSRSMLSQIERSESSPTVATLWNLTQALKVDFAGLLDSPDGDDGPFKDILRAGRTPTIESRGDGCRIRILSPPEQAGRHEIYDVHFSTGGALVSEPHRHGCQEHLTVLSGTITITSDTATETLQADDTARYAADRPHAIRAVDGPARALLVVQHT
ncbi:MAG: helix-turn-helix domain-containing protein [Pseudomonadota bacterium]